MNLKKLREAESLFLLQYPDGFADEGLKDISKRHNVGKLSEFASEALKKSAFNNQGRVLDDIVRIVSRSSMVSMFEKPKFRDYVNGLSRNDREFLAVHKPVHPYSGCDCRCNRELMAGTPPRPFRASWRGHGGCAAGNSCVVHHRCCVRG